VFYFSYGAIVFFSLFTFQYEQSAEIILQITGLTLAFQFFWIGLAVSFLAFLLCLILSKKNLTHYLLELGLLVVLAFLFSNASLLFGFGLYFVLWHSIPSLNSQLKYIYKASTRNSLLQYLKAAALYWILALAGMLLFYYFVRVPEDQYLSIFFSFLAAITFPHAVVMGLMFHSKDSNEE
jgi:Brp/Blh family beta-carotene 15,15'-monooxygenase